MIVGRITFSPILNDWRNIKPVEKIRKKKEQKKKEVKDTYDNKMFDDKYETKTI